MLINVLFLKCRYKESEINYKKYLEHKPGNSAAEKELSQLHQARSALETASSLHDSGDLKRALEYVDKVVLVFSPACSKVSISRVLFTRPVKIFICLANLFNKTTLLTWQAKLLKVKLLLASKDYSGAIAETGYILKEDENDLDALLIRGRAYYYLADHDVAMRFDQGLVIT